MRVALIALLLALPPLLAAGPAAATKPAVPVQPDRATSCVLRGGLAALIRLHLNAALPPLNGGRLGSNLKVDAIVIHAVANPNNGQPLDGGGFTGPIVCTFQETLVRPQQAYTIAAADPNADIQNIDLLSSDVQTLIQYRRPSGAGSIETLLCLSTRNNNDCFRLSPRATR